MAIVLSAILWLMVPSWLYGSWIYSYLCIQWLSSLQLWGRILIRRGVLDSTLCDKVCQWLGKGRGFSPGPPVSSTNKTDRHDITELLLKVASNINIDIHWLISYPQTCISVLSSHVTLTLHKTSTSWILYSFPRSIGNHGRNLCILLTPFGLYAPKDFRFECTWWRLFLKHVYDIISYDFYL